MKIYGDTKSGNCYKVRLVCGLLGIKPEWIDVDILAGDTHDCSHAAPDRLKSGEIANWTTTLTHRANRWLMPKINRFQEKYPHLKLSIMPSFNLVDFQGDGVDLAIRYGKGDYPGLESRFSWKSRLCPCAIPRSLVTEPLINPSPKIFRGYLMTRLT